MLNGVPGDLVLTADGSSFEYATGTDRLQQRLALEFLTPAGSCRFDTRIGFPWIQLLAEKADSGTRQAAVRQKLLSFPEISSIAVLRETVDRPNRAVSYEYIVRTTQGELVEGELGFPLLAEGAVPWSGE